MKSRPRTVLFAASTIHFLHDGFSETLYVFLPLWASEFGLSFSQVGLIRTAYTGGNWLCGKDSQPAAAMNSGFKCRSYKFSTTFLVTASSHAASACK